MIAVFAPWYGLTHGVRIAGLPVSGVLFCWLLIFRRTVFVHAAWVVVVVIVVVVIVAATLGMLRCCASPSRTSLFLSQSSSGTAESAGTRLKRGLGRANVACISLDSRSAIFVGVAVSGATTGVFCDFGNGSGVG